MGECMRLSSTLGPAHRLTRCLMTHETHLSVLGRHPPEVTMLYDRPMNSGSGITIDGLSFAYGASSALMDVSFSVERGCFTGLLGPNGAGKSTLLSLLTGLLAMQLGEAYIDDINIRVQPRRALARLGIVFQSQALDLDLTVAQNMAYAAALRGYWGGNARRRIDEKLELMGIAHRGREKTRKLNGGHRRRLEIARALVHQPTVLILDEPTVGLDIPSRSQLVEHVHQLATSENLTVLWATHLVDEIRKSDNLVVLHRGQLRAAGPVAQILAQHGGDSVPVLFERLTSADEASKEADA